MWILKNDDGTIISKYENRLEAKRALSHVAFNKLYRLRRIYMVKNYNIDN